MLLKVFEQKTTKAIIELIVKLLNWYTDKKSIKPSLFKLFLMLSTKNLTICTFKNI